MMNRFLGAACLCAAMFVITGCPSDQPGNGDTGPGGSKDASCTPKCEGKVCGDDGCGGTCAPGCTSSQTCENGECKCKPNCEGKVCGDDGCGGTCAPGCTGNQECTAEGTCQIKICIPDCAGKDCGSDGCGGFCGDNRGGCPEGKTCNTNSKCELCTAQCEAGQECGEDANKCSCGSCQVGFQCDTATKKCVTCTPSCEGKDCGDNGCGGSCGTCASGTGCSVENKCVGCTPGPECAGKACGFDAKGCSCGTCASDKFCQRDGSCAVCPDTGGSVTIDTLCTKLDGGLKKWAAWSYQMCGMPINDSDPTQLQSADIDHMDAEFLQWSGMESYVQMFGYDPHPIVGVYGPYYTCQYLLKEPYEALKASAQAGNVCFDSKAVDQCIQAGIDLKKQNKYGFGEPAVCSKFFVANTDEGKACNYQWECKAPTYCKPTNDQASCGGVCAQPLALGATCTPNDICATDSTCTADESTGASTCVSLPKEGEDCSADYECVTGFVCSYDDGETCVASAKEGEACRFIDVEYGDYNCVSGLDCVDSTTGAACAEGGTCVCQAAAAPPPPAQYGEDCDPENPTCDYCLFCNEETLKCDRRTKIGDTCLTINGTDTCVDAFYGFFQECVADTTTGAKTCALRPRQEQACTVDPNEQDADGNPLSLYVMRQGNCLYVFDNYCKRSAADGPGVCSPLPKTGEPCNDSFNSAPYCQGGYCNGYTAPNPADGTGGTDGVCVEWDENGTACLNGDLCNSSLCVLDPLTEMGKCGEPAKAGEPCAEDFSSPGDYYCERNAYCAEKTPDYDAGSLVDDAGVAIKGPMYCFAKKAGGEACEGDEQCLTGTCSADKVCTYDCGYSPGADSAGCGDYTGFNYWSKFIFVSGTLVLFGLRRRRFAK